MTKTQYTTLKWACEQGRQFVNQQWSKILLPSRRVDLLRQINEAETALTELFTGGVLHDFET